MIGIQVVADAALGPDDQVSTWSAGRQPDLLGEPALRSVLQARLDEREGNVPGRGNRVLGGRERERGKSSGDRQQRSGRAECPSGKSRGRQRNDDPGIRGHQYEADQPDPADGRQRQHYGMLPLARAEDGPRAADSLPRPDPVDYYPAARDNHEGRQGLARTWSGWARQPPGRGGPASAGCGIGLAAEQEPRGGADTRPGSAEHDHDEQ